MSTEETARIDASRKQIHRRSNDRKESRQRKALLAVGVGLLSWASVTTPLRAGEGEESTSELAKAKETAPARAVSGLDALAVAWSDLVLLTAAWTLRSEQPELFGDAGGILVLESLPGSEAQAVGLRPGDILLRYDGQPLYAPDGLLAATQRASQGWPVFIDLLRAGLPHRIEFQTGCICARLAAVAEPPAPESTPQSKQMGLYDKPVLVLDTGMHTAPIRWADVDAAGRLAVTGSDDKTVRLWALDGDLEEPLATLRMPAGPGSVGRVFAAALGPAGDLIAAGGVTGSRPGGNNIYVFTPDGQLIKRIGALPAAVIRLSFSPDGRWLAAGLGDGKGIRIYERDAGWAEVAPDAEDGVAVLGLAFATDGRLATTSGDGKVRLYDAQFGRTAEKSMTAHGLPVDIVFHPEGNRLAVAFDRPAVVLLDGQTLAPLARQLDLTGIDNGDLSIVAWSRDGSTLFSAGTYKVDGRNPVIAWSDAGTGARRIHDRGTLNTVTSLHALANGGLLVATADPSLAVFGSKPVVRASPSFDAQGQSHNLAVSADGLLVDFGFGEFGTEDRHRFDLAALTLTPLAAPDGLTAVPRHTGLPIEQWVNSVRPTLAGTPLPLNSNETVRSLAIHPDGQRFVLGTDWFLRAFDAAGQTLGSRDEIAAVYAVNITGDGRLVVAAYGDGTIRWHRMDDGRELLAFFPMNDRKNWVAWTPEGFYGATPGARGVLKWHVNRGWDRLADAYPISQFRYLSRPDALPLVLQEGDTARALGLADISRAEGEVQRITDAGLPSGARLHLVGFGVSKYGEKASHLSLKFADKDVEDVHSALLKTQLGLYAEVKPQPLTNESATKANLMSALDAVQELMADGTGGDLAVFHFSGHGALIDQEYFLLPHEVDARTKEQIRNTSIWIKELRMRLVDLGSYGYVLVLLDACRSGAATQAGDPLAVDGDELRRGLAGLPNVAVLTSSSSTTPSVEHAEWQNGAFTEVLLRALGNDADTDQNGLIHVNELTGYLSEHLPRLADGTKVQKPGTEVHFQRELFVSDL